MQKRNKAIALCRVSSAEQLENNSLNRQRESVLNAAKSLDVDIPSDGWWSGNMSSKKGTNLDRPDLLQMLNYCRKDRNVKYLIVDRTDRFMRSIDEAIYFEVEFSKFGVKVWYASDKELNSDDLMAKLLKFTKYFSAEGSNDDRIEQSIGGAIKALEEGRYPFAPKPGYKGGQRRGIPDIHPVRGPALKEILLKIVSKEVTPTQALIELNKSSFIPAGRSAYKMDKFRKIATDPFYAGIVEVDKQVKVRNESGQHDALISIEQHNEILRIFEAKGKNQKGPRKNGNPDYPLSNHVTCALCVDKSSIPRYAGYKHSNGKGILFYHKYRCRSCNRYLSRDELHPKIIDLFKRYPINQEGVSDLSDALDHVWKRREEQTKVDIMRMSQKIDYLNKEVRDQAIAAIKPENISIKAEILNNIELSRQEIVELEEKLSKASEKVESDKDLFLKFAFQFVDNMGQRFLEISPEDRLRCKLIVFPAGFYLDAENNVYTPQISPLITLQTNKKDAEASINDQMVRVEGV